MRGNNSPVRYYWYAIRTVPFWPNSIDKVAVMSVLLHPNDTNAPKDDVGQHNNNHLNILIGIQHSYLFWLNLFFLLDWQQFVTNKLWAWEQMNLQWAKNFTGLVHIVYYDDLVEDVDRTLRNILNFLDYPIDNVTNLTLFNS